MNDLAIDIYKSTLTMQFLITIKLYYRSRQNDPCTQYHAIMAEMNTFLTSAMNGGFIFQPSLSLGKETLDSIGEDV
jgi:hypothetical protein